MAEVNLNAERMEQIINLFGSMDENIRIVEQEFDVSIVNRDTELKISGDAENAAAAAKVVEGLLQLSGKGEPIGEQNVRYVIGLVRQGQEGEIAALTKDVICITAKGKPIKAKTLGQQKYMKAIAKNRINAKPGQRVVISSRTSKVFSAAILVYIVPLIFFVTGFAIASAFGASEGVAILVSFVFLAFSALLLVRSQKNRAEEKQISFEIIS